MDNHDFFHPMQNWSLTVDKFIDHAARWHGHREIVSCDTAGGVSKTNWSELHALSKRISNALKCSGIGHGDRVATLAMNSANHLAVWFGAMGIGAVCHTLNPRLSKDQLEYIINHAEDKIIFADIEFQPLLLEIISKCPSVCRIIWLDHDDEDSLETYVAPHSVDCEWGDFDENTPAGLCYTSGTTGKPKGVLYTHRSTYLHTMMVLQPDVFNISARDAWLPVVPMFHANAWGLTFAAAAVGAKLVLPGRQLDGSSLYSLMHSEGVNKTAGVPTVWQTLLQHMDENNLQLKQLGQVMIGGAACSKTLYQAFVDRGIAVQHNWGMTETSPLGTAATLTGGNQHLDQEEQINVKLKQGRVPIGVDMCIVNAQGDTLPHDGVQPGFLHVRGHSVVGNYYRTERTALNSTGFFDTGDVATIDASGFMQITDRAKDVIKSGGEWISSVDMENAVLAHPDVELAAVIGIPHPKWGERPLLLTKLRANCAVDAHELRELLSAHFAKWELPEIILTVNNIPLGATGKIDKKKLRNCHANGGAEALQAL